jgi:hypothetical protein
MKAKTWGKKTMLPILLVIKAWMNPWKLPYYLSNLDTNYIILRIVENFKNKIPNNNFFEIEQIYVKAAKVPTYS